MITLNQKETLIQAACTVRPLAYAPYSHYQVGAALLTSNNHIITGVNVENASYGLTNCAERTAVFQMVSQGEQEIKAVAVCTANGGAPCGACRQVLAEFATDIPIYLSDIYGNVQETTLYTLLPNHFSPKFLTALQNEHN